MNVNENEKQYQTFKAHIEQGRIGDLFCKRSLTHSFLILLLIFMAECTLWQIPISLVNLFNERVSTKNLNNVTRSSVSNSLALKCAQIILMCFVSMETLFNAKAYPW